MQAKEKIGIGTDIESIERFNKMLTDNPLFFEKVFTETEIAYCRSKHNPAQHFAARFVGKEAIIKALADLGIPSVKFPIIEIINTEKGIPKVIFINPKYSNIQVNLSLSHNSTTAIAFAVARMVDHEE